jgi:uncharacterized membrane protein
MMPSDPYLVVFAVPTSLDAIDPAPAAWFLASMYVMVTAAETARQRYIEDRPLGVAFFHATLWPGAVTFSLVLALALWAFEVSDAVVQNFWSDDTE